MRFRTAFISFLLMAFIVTPLVSCQTHVDETGLKTSITQDTVASISPDTEGPAISLTPIEELGITGVTQDVDIAEYRLIIDGLVEEPLSLTYETILAYPSVTEIVALNCPGYFIDVAEWTGVPLMTLLAEAGIEPGASNVIFSSVDGYRRMVSLEHVNRFEVFLAYKVNGETLPPEHGYPLRVVDKGSEGNAWVKWLEKIEVE